MLMRRWLAGCNWDTRIRLPGLGCADGCPYARSHPNWLEVSRHSTLRRRLLWCDKDELLVMASHGSRIEHGLCVSPLSCSSMESQSAAGI